MKKDLSNIDDVLARLFDDEFLIRMVNRAYEYVIEIIKYSHAFFVASCDDVLTSLPVVTAERAVLQISSGLKVTMGPIRTASIKLPPYLAACWHAISINVRAIIYPAVRKAVATLKT